MTLRNSISDRKRLAHEILDKVRAGLHVENSQVRWALVTLGDVE
jgi:hypothetical protein